jgi:hypothetical protein
MKIAIIVLSIGAISAMIGNYLGSQHERINYLETELRSVRYHYLKCSTAFLDSNLHAKCFQVGK